MGVRGELCLVMTAINNRWPLTAEKRQQITESTFDILISSPKNRDKLAAAKILLAMEAQNQKDEQNTGLNELRSRLIELAASAGIDRTVLGISDQTEG